MSYIGNRDFFIEVAKGTVAKHSLVHKFGATEALTTALIPIASAGVYPTPTVAVSLELVSSSASDALNSTGMHELTIEGLDASGALQTQPTAAHATDGTVAVAISGTWLRVFRAFVSSSGTYATSAAPSHVGTITIRVAGAGATYADIPLSNSFAIGQSLIGAYTVPLGYTAYILGQEYGSDVAGTKNTSFYFFKRENILDVSSSYSGTMRVQQVKLGTQGNRQSEHFTPDGFSALTDIGFLGIASTGTNDAYVEFEMLLVQD